MNNIAVAPGKYYCIPTEWELHDSTTNSYGGLYIWQTSRSLMGLIKGRQWVDDRPISESTLSMHDCCQCPRALALVLLLTLCTRKMQTTARQTIFGPMAAQYGGGWFEGNQWRRWFSGDCSVLGGGRMRPRTVSLWYNGKRQRLRRGSGVVGALGLRWYYHGRDWCLAAQFVHYTIRAYGVVSCCRYAGACDDDDER